MSNVFLAAESESVISLSPTRLGFAIYVVTFFRRQ